MEICWLRGRERRVACLGTVDKHRHVFALILPVLRPLDDHSDSTFAQLDLFDPIVAVDGSNAASIPSDSQITLPADLIASQHWSLDANLEKDLKKMTRVFVHPLSVVKAPDLGLGR